VIDQKASEIYLLRFPEVKRRVGLGRTQIYMLEKQGKFPERVQLGPRCCAWRSNEISAWIESRPRASTMKNGSQI